MCGALITREIKSLIHNNMQRSSTAKSFVCVGTSNALLIVLEISAVLSKIY